MDVPAFFPVSHPLRRLVLEEVHARPFQLVQTPRRFIQAAFATNEPGEAEASWQVLDQWCAATSAQRPDPGAKFHMATFPDATLRFESHTEFTAWTWDTSLAPAEPFAWPLTEPPPFTSGFAPPGRFMVGVDLAIVAEEDAPASLERLFDATSLCVTTAYDDSVRLATDFRQDARGNTRILILDRGLGLARAGALVQRVLEIETYRTFALLGLPEAVRVSPIVGKIERELVDVTKRMRNTTGLQDNSALLDKIVANAAELETESAISAYRFGATRAYNAIVSSRLDAIKEGASDSHSSWRSFLDRRMAPAMRTCQSVADRQAELSSKLSRAANLLRTRVEVEIQSQNTSLLEAMNERARVQLRLQQTVEGLSVAAVSYYILGLLSYLFKGASDARLLPLDPNVATAATLPLVLFGVWWTVRRLRRGEDVRDRD